VNRRDAGARTLLALAALCAIAYACLIAPGVAAAPKVSRNDWTAIKKTISQQLAALRAGQDERAFGYASAGIQAQFGDARNFMTMVRTAYAPLLEARYTEFLEGAVVDGVIVQPLRLIAPDNTVRVALYTMEKHKGTWRINGCRLAPSTVKAA
jgi:Domain of unknown function (DUF4864)